MAGYVFETAEDALKWAVEVLRRRRLPKTANFWREIEREAEWVEQAWEGGKNLELPQGEEERMGLALKIIEAVEELGARDQAAGRLLQLWALGDWADEGRLQAAMMIQEKCRREGIRVRLAYRYTYAQLGAVLGCERKTAWRKVQEALEKLGEGLAVRGVTGMVEGGKGEDSSFKKTLYSHEFKFNSE